MKTEYQHLFHRDLDPFERIIADGKRVVIFTASGKVSPELNETGVQIFNVKKIKEFIYWPRELTQDIKDKIENQ